MKIKIFKAKEGCEPLFRKGDKFVIIKKNRDPGLMPIEAMKITSNEIFGFEEDELEEVTSSHS